MFFIKGKNLFGKIVFTISLFFLVLIFFGLTVCTASMNWNFISVSYKFSLFNTSTILLVLLLMLLFLLKPYFQNVKGISLLVFSYIVIIFISLIFIFGFDPNPSVDAENVIDEAIKWYETGYISGWYMQVYPYQYAMISFLKVLLSLFKNIEIVINVIRLINITALLVIDYVVFNITLEVTNEKYAGLASLMLSLMLFPEMLTTFVYGDLIGYAFAFVSLYLCIKNANTFRLKQFVLQIVTLFFGIYFRVPTIIIGIAQAIIIIFYYKKHKLYSIIGILVTIYFANNICALILENIYKIETYNLPLISRTAMSFDVYGMGIREPGWITSYTMDVTEKCLGDAACIKYESSKYLAEVFGMFIDNPRLGVDYLTRKFYSQWLIPDFEGFSLLKLDSVTNHASFGFGVTIADSYFIFFTTIWMKSLFMLIVLGACYAIFKIFMNRNTNNNCLFALTLILCGCFAYYWIGEVKARYVIPYVFIMIPLFAVGISYLFNTSAYLIKNNKYVSLITVISIVVLGVALYKDHKNSILPVLKYEAYTDTQELQQLVKGTYYQIPITITEKMELANVSLYLCNDSRLYDLYLQVDIIDESDTVVKSKVVDFNYQERGYIWKEVAMDSWLEEGNYIIQVSSSNTDNVGLSIILGEQYNYVNQDYLKINGYKSNYRANFKLYKNHY